MIRVENPDKFNSDSLFYRARFNTYRNAYVYTVTLPDTLAEVLEEKMKNQEFLSVSKAIQGIRSFRNLSF